MNKKPLVSCIIIFFNAGEKFFIEAIESIFAQTYDNWELLLADDGSTDESTAIALRYAQKYPEKVRYVQHENHQNRGMSATRNLGIRHAKGEYIAFLDADDLWLPHKLEQQVPILESHPEVAMLYGRTKYWFSWTENNPTIWKLNPEDPEDDFLTITSFQFDTVVKPPTQLLLFLQNKEIYPCTCSILIRRQIFQYLGGFEEDFRNAHEDMVFHSKLFLKAPVYVSSECWDLYRMHPDSYWRRADLQGKGAEIRRIGHIKYLNWLETYLCEQQIQDAEIWQALNQALLPYRYPILYRLIKFIQQPKQHLILLARKISRQVLPNNIRSSLGEYIRLLAIQNSTKHIFGLKTINFFKNDFIVLCVVRNGETFINSFIEHYLTLGAKHIFFFDNESTDRTIEIASKYEKITIIQTKYKPASYKPLMKKYLIEKYSKNHSYILAEVNELFDNPGENKQEYVLVKAHPH
jgi:glycosyltransferase involved in cell wall biosynthesis